LKEPTVATETKSAVQTSTPSAMDLDPALRSDLRDIYEEVMYLAGRPNVSPSLARCWYTHIWRSRDNKKKRRQPLRLISNFTGYVSKAAAESESARLSHEHYRQRDTKLTELVKRHLHLKASERDPEEFIRGLQDWEHVHIVTRKENEAAKAWNGDYKLAGIELLHWSELRPERRKTIWQEKLRGQVANANDYAPEC
jgi:hypothetical protein